MIKIMLIVLALASTVYSAEIPSTYSILNKHPEPTAETLTEPKPDVAHPIYRAEEPVNQGRARIEPVRPSGPVIRHDAMLSDQPVAQMDPNINEQGIFGNGYIPNVAEVAYPDSRYAPGYEEQFYNSPYNRQFYPGAEPEPYEDNMFALSPYLPEPYSSTFDLLWSQVPDGRALVGFVGRTIRWVFESLVVILIGSLVTVGICSYTSLCTINFNDFHDQMRMLMTPASLESVGQAAHVVSTAIDKIQKIQKEKPTKRKRLAIFNN